ncbi:uncharacterized protein TRIVIDRAFT_132539, partial [Trichoderma virens Gv29-8]
MPSPNDYTVGWICAITTEYVAAQAFLDEKHDAPEYVSPNDNNIYTLGKVGKHNIVISSLPDGEYGTAAAASVARDMLRSFPNVRIGLMVGIGGGAPSPEHDVRLGDVIVSAPRNGQGGVIQYDFGKTIQSQAFQSTRFLDQPPTLLRGAVHGLKAQYEIEGHRFQETINNVLEQMPRLQKKYQRPHLSTDRLYRSQVVHPSDSNSTCAVACGNDGSTLLLRQPRAKDEDNPAIHYGLIASGNQLMKDALIRDRLICEKGVLCFEMEAAGLMNHFPCLIIRGICDYSDSHKNKDWQGYAAMTAAAYAKDLLQQIAPNRIEILDALSGVKEGINQLVRTQHDKEHATILDWLTPVDYGPQQSDYLRRRQEGTGKWLIDSDQFQKWLGDEIENRTLFCPGIPGAGKTILSSIVIDYLSLEFQDNPKIGLAYIYFNYKRRDEQTIYSLLASLLKQLAEYQSSLPKVLQDLYDRHKTKRTRPSIEELAHALHSVAAIYSRVFIVVDALDECESSDGRRSKLLSEIFALQDKCGANLLVTSRIITDITETFHSVPTLEVRATEEDIRKYLSSNMFQLPQFVLHNPILQEQIITSILEVVQGMFLLAQLHLDSLKGKTRPKAITAALKNLASGSNAYEQAYDETMERITSQYKDRVQLAKSILCWITYAGRPLTATELQHVLGVEPGESAIDEQNLPDIELIVSVCAGLITIDNESNITRLVHYTAQEYLQRTHKKWFQEPQSEITTVCVTYLLYKEFESGACSSDEAFESRLKSYPFYEYASHYWGHHARQACVKIPSIMELLENMTKVESSCQVLMAEKRWDNDGYYYSGRFPRHMTGLHLAAYFGISDAAKLLLERTINIEATDSYDRTPLHYAASNRQEAVVQLLIKQGADIKAIDKDGQTPLHHAIASHGYKAIIQLLIERGADIEAKDKDGQTPLHHAASHGHEAIIQLLIERGADIEAKDKDGQTPLHHAPSHGHEAIIQLLIERGADIEAIDNSGRTPLLQATWDGQEAVIRKLIEQAANIEATDSDGRTPLHLAAFLGETGIIRQLTEQDANIEAMDNNGQTPLHSA